MTLIGQRARRDQPPAGRSTRPRCRRPQRMAGRAASGTRAARAGVAADAGSREVFVHAATRSSASIQRRARHERFTRTLKTGDRVGPYELVRELGSGGMAEVWLARRADGAYKREVALKLPKLTRLRRNLERHYERERDILASLEHPNIARLYDAGLAPDGLPYLAMEYVQGQPLTAWCDAHRVGLRDRLKLLLQVDRGGAVRP